MKIFKKNEIVVEQKVVEIEVRGAKRKIRIMKDANGRIYKVGIRTLWTPQQNKEWAEKLHKVKHIIATVKKDSEEIATVKKDSEERTSYYKTPARKTAWDQDLRTLFPKLPEEIVFPPYAPYAPAPRMSAPVIGGAIGDADHEDSSDWSWTTDEEI